MKNERTFLFLAAVMIAFTQITTGTMILHYFEEHNNVYLHNAKSFTVLIPRIVSSIMMHLNVVGEIEQGILNMKYAVNHPFMFAPYDESLENEEEDDGGEGGEKKKKKNLDDVGPTFNTCGMQRRVTMAFLLGFLQATVGIYVEIMIIYYLSTLDSLFKVIC